MDEKRIIVLYEDEQLKDEILKRLDAEIVGKNDDETQLKIAKDKLELLADELDLDIDDLEKEWEEATPEPQEAKTDIPSQVDKLVMKYGNYDKIVEEFSPEEFLNDSRINSSNKTIRIYSPRANKFLEISIEFADAVPTILVSLLAENSQKPIYRQKLLSYEAWMRAIHTLNKIKHDIECLKAAKDSHDPDTEMYLRPLYEASNLKEFEEAESDYVNALNAGYVYLTKMEEDRLKRWRERRRQFFIENPEGIVEDSFEYIIPSEEFIDYAKTMKERHPEMDADMLWEYVVRINEIYLPVFSREEIDEHEHELRELFEAKFDDLHKMISDIKDDNDYWKALHELALADKFNHVTGEEYLKLSNMLQEKYNMIQAQGMSFEKMLEMLKAFEAAPLYDDLFNDIDKFFESTVAPAYEKDLLTDEQYEQLADIRERIEAKISANIFKDSDNVHKIDVSDVDIKALAAFCDMLDEGSVKNSLKDNILTITLGPAHWKELKIAYPNVLAKEIKK